MSDTESSVSWWERTAELVPYAGLHQGENDHCVFAAVAGAVNHLLGRQAWTIDSLLKVYGEDRETWTLAVAPIAIAPFPGRLEVLEHNTKRGSGRLSPAVLRSWIRGGGLVILSLPVRNGGWHMFTLVACTDTGFQVWDSNGHPGRFYDHEIKTGIPHPRQDDNFYDPHPDEDLVVIRKRYSLFPASP